MIPSPPTSLDIEFSSWVIVVAALLTLAAVALAIRAVFRESRKAVALDRRLQAVRAQVASVWGESGTLQEEVRVALSYASVVVAGLVRFAAVLVPVGASERAKIGELIRQAGFKQRDSLAVFLSAKMILMLAGGAAGGYVAAGVEQLGGHIVVVSFAALAGAVLGGLLPEAVLRRLGVQRRSRLTRALPDALDLMVLCVEAGYTFERALHMVSLELRPLSPGLAGELGAVEAELRLGADRKVALQGLYQRTGVEGLRDFAMTVVQGERYGTPMGQSLQNIAHNERARRQAQIETLAGRLPVIMSLPMLLLVVPGIILLMGGPAFLMAIQALQGWSAG